jgi:hypothetical protein
MSARHTPGRTASQFLDAVRGIPANHVAQALNTFTPGILWTGSTKARMAERWVEAETATHRDDRALIAAPLDLVRARALARSAGVGGWRDAVPNEATSAKQLIADLHKVIDNCGASVTEQHIARLIRAAIAKATGSADAT